MANKIFEVDIKGLRQLQEGKPKWFIIRELLQNAMDEDIKVCTINFYHERGKAHISVEDDSPTGFRDLADAYTLFKDTYKRTDVKKRGRFNFGEKQVLCMCDYAMITSTTGGLEFDLLKGEKKTLRKKRMAGSEVYVVVKMTREEYEECKKYAYEILRPLEIAIRVVEHSSIDMDTTTGVVTSTGYRFPHLRFDAVLPTEEKINDQMKTVRRECEVHIHKSFGDAYIYELGIPICSIDCDYSIDVQQKVPLSSDRDKVDGKYLKDIFALVLNNTIDEIDKENISQTWIREALDSDKVEADTIQDVKDKRFGEKAVIFNPNDPVANDEAMAQGYKLIYGSEMGSNEWSKMKEHAGLVSSSKMFGSSSATDATGITKGIEHDHIEELTERIAALISLDVSVSFYKSRQATVLAQYSSDGQLAFNCSKIPKDWFQPDASGYVREQMLDLIIHELGHSGGHHTQHSYHECLTRLAARCTRKAIEDKRFFHLSK